MNIQYAYICDWGSDEYELFNLRLLENLLEGEDLAERAYDSMDSDREPTFPSKFGGVRLGAAT